MKLRTKVGDLGRALALADLLLDHPDKMVKKIAALSAVRISAVDDALTLTANTLDFQITVKAELNIEEPGETAVSLSALAALIAALPTEAMINIAATANNMTVTAPRGRYRLAVLPIQDLPAALISDPGLGRVELAGNDMLHLLDPIATADTETRRPYMAGVFLHSVGDDLVGVGTDGHQLICIAVPADKFSTDRRCIIPLKAVKVLRKLIKASKPARVILRRSKTLIALETELFTFVSRLIDAEFPAYEAILPLASDNAAVVDRCDMIAVLHRLNAVATKGDLPAVGAFRWGQQKDSDELLVFLPQQPADGSEQLAAQRSGSGEAAFPISQLVSLLEELPGDQVRFELNGHGAITIRIAGDQNVVALQTTITLQQLNAA